MYEYIVRLHSTSFGPSEISLVSRVVLSTCLLNLCFTFYTIYDTHLPYIGRTDTSLDSYSDQLLHVLRGKGNGDVFCTDSCVSLHHKQRQLSSHVLSPRVVQYRSHLLTYPGIFSVEHTSFSTPSHLLLTHMTSSRCQPVILTVCFVALLFARLSFLQKRCRSSLRASSSFVQDYVFAAAPFGSPGSSRATSSNAVPLLRP